MVKKEKSLESVFGLLRSKKINTQKVKDEIRKEEAVAEKRKWGKYLK